MIAQFCNLVIRQCAFCALNILDWRERGGEREREREREREERERNCLSKGELERNIQRQMHSIAFKYIERGRGRERESECV